MSHLSYLDRVNWQARQARLAAEANRRNGILQGRRRIQFGEDPAAVAASLPHPSPVTRALTPDVVQAATRAFSYGPNPSTAVQEGLQAVSSCPSGAGIDAVRSALSPSSTVGFDAGVALANGAAKSGGRTPHGMSAGQKAGWLMAFGVEGAAPAVASSVMQGAVQGGQGMASGAATAVKAMASGTSAVDAAAGGLTDAQIGAVIAVGVPAVIIGGLTAAGVFKGIGVASLVGVGGLVAIGSVGLGVMMGNRYATALAGATSKALGMGASV